MFGGVADTWKQNNGSLIIVIALSLTLVACSLRYFNLLPDIELQPPQVVGNEARSMQQRQSAMLIVTIIAPNRMPTARSKGYLEMQVPAGTIDQPVERISIHPFEIQAGGMTSVVVDHLPSGQYTPLVYLDFNENGSLDFDDERRPQEPIRTGKSSTSMPASAALLDNAIQLDSGRPKYIYMQF